MFSEIICGVAAAAASISPEERRKLEEMAREPEPCSGHPVQDFIGRLIGTLLIISPLLLLAWILHG